MGVNIIWGKEAAVLYSRLYCDLCFYGLEGFSLNKHTIHVAKFMLRRQNKRLQQPNPMFHVASGKIRSTFDAFLCE